MHGARGPVLFVSTEKTLHPIPNRTFTVLPYSLSGALLS